MAIRWFGFATLVLVVDILVLGNSAQIECGGDLDKILSECKDFVQKDGPVVPPSGSCCSALKDVDVPCLCKFVTPDFEKLISMEKAMYVARTCGCKNIPAAGNKCGSYTVLPPPPPHPPKM